MSSANAIVTIIILLAVLVCYAFIVQTLKQKREQHKRLLAALKARSRNFKFMLNGFPQGFLPRDLTLLVQRSLIDVCEQLSRLEPREPSHVQDLQTFSTMMAETQRHAKPSHPVTLNSAQQIKEVKLCLEELHRFIHNLEERLVLNRTQAENYRSHIRQLVLQITVDGYAIQGRSAQQANKLKLAYHYFDLALKLLVREGKPGAFAERVEQYKLALQNIAAELSGEDAEGLSEQELAEQLEIAQEWDKFGTTEDIWKKKHAYD